MQTVIELLTPLQMVIVNLCVVDVCSHRKYSKGKTFGVLFMCTAIIFAVFYLCMSKTEHLGNGNGLFVTVGFLYLIPMKALYRESVTEILSILCSSWIYTTLLFSFSVHTGYFLQPNNLALTVLVIQTVLYVCTVYIFIQWIKSKFLYVLKNITPDMKRYLLYISISWFFTITIINFTFVYNQIGFLKLVSLIALIVNAILTYTLMIHLVKSFRNIGQLEQIVSIDYLTGLKNRMRFFSDVEDYVENDKPFRLIYMDLNKFKEINDRYGHHIGDKYLKYFAERTSDLLQGCGQLYRIAGDEFICIYTGEDVERFILEITRQKDGTKSKDIPFLGCSFGYAEYPKDSRVVETLIMAADRRMYENKKDTWEGEDVE